MGEPARRGGVAILVPTPQCPAKSVRVNITLPADILGEVDRYAEAHGLTRSGFIVRAAKREMAV